MRSRHFPGIKNAQAALGAQPISKPGAENRDNDNVALHPDDIAAIDLLDAIRGFRNIGMPLTPIESSRVVNESHAP